MSKLIDFDDCFRPGSVPKPESLVGDFKYYSPELGAYVSNEEYDQHLAERLTAKSDIYALGLVFYLYLTARSVPLPSGHRTAWQASSVNSLPELTTGISSQIDNLVNAMLSRDIGARPSAVQVFDRLKEVQRSLRATDRDSGYALESELPDRVSTAPTIDPGVSGATAPIPDNGSTHLKIKMRHASLPHASEDKKTEAAAELVIAEDVKPRILIKGLRSSMATKERSEHANPDGI